MIRNQLTLFALFSLILLGGLLFNGTKVSAFTIDACYTCGPNPQTGANECVFHPSGSAGCDVPPPSAYLKASPTTVNYQNTTTLSWWVDDVPTGTYCNRIGPWGSPDTFNSSTGLNDTPSLALTADSTFELDCYKDYSGSPAHVVTSSPVTVTVTPQSPQSQGATTPSVTLSASPTSVSSGSKTTLTWNATNAKSCSVTGPWSSYNGSLSSSGLSDALTSNSTFTIACVGNGSSNAAQLGYICNTPGTCPLASGIFMNGELDKATYAPGAPISMTVTVSSDDNPQGVTPIATGQVPGQSASADFFPSTYTPQQIRNTITMTKQIGTAPTTPGSYNVTTYYGSGGYTNNTLSLPFTVTSSGAGASASASVTVTGTNNATCGTMTVPSTLAAGQTFAASVTMNNTGNTTWTAGGTNPYRLGTQTPQDNTTWGVSRVDVPTTVAPGSSVTFSGNLTAPTTPGTYTFAWKMVQEYIEWFGATCSQTVTVTSAQPDLTISVDAASSPSAPTPGSAATLSATVKNQGSAAVSGTYNNMIQVDPASDTGHNSPTNVAASTLSNTAAGGTGNISASYTFASAGTYYLRACANTLNNSTFTVSESNTGNNCGSWIPVTVSTTPPPTAPDLIISVDAASNPASPVTGNSATLSATVKNQGTGAVSGTYNNIIQIDDNTDHSALYATLTTNTLSNTPANGTGSISASYVAPAAGIYYVRACANTLDNSTFTVSESNTANNCGNWKTVTITSAPTTDCTGTTVGNCVLPDSTDGSVVDGSCAAGYTGACNYTCTNTVWSQNNNTCTSTSNPSGNITASSCTVPAGSSNCTSQVNWSVSNVSSVQVTRAGVNWSTALQGPKNSSVSGGTATKFVLLDSSTGATLDSVNRRGTCAAGSGWNGTICEAGYLPDLTANAITPTTAQKGTSVTLKALIINQGPAPTGSGGSFNNFIQIATATNGGGSISDLGNSSMNQLAGGASATTSKSYTFNSIGTYSARACADKRNRNDNGSITEIDENNNCGAWVDVIVTGPVPTATLSANPTSVNPGSSSTLTWSSTNSTSCQFADQGTAVGTSGTRNVRPTVDSTYSMTCTDGTTTSAPALATVTINNPIMTITANPPRVQKGNTTSITANASNVKWCSTSRSPTATGWPKAGNANGSNIYTATWVDTITAQTTYTMTCKDLNNVLYSTPAVVVVNITPNFQEF